MDNRLRKLSVDDLACLFEGKTRLVERLAQRIDPLGEAQALLQEVPEEELIEALNAHPRIGARALPATSAREQGGEENPSVLEELHRLNELYEAAFGFRFVVFVNRRTKVEIVRVMRERLARPRQDELRTAVEELLAIARDRHRDMTERDHSPGDDPPGTAAPSGVEATMDKAPQSSHQTPGCRPGR